MRTMAVVLAVTLFGCQASSPAAPEFLADAELMDLSLDPAFRARYLAIEGCVGMNGDFDRVTWYNVSIPESEGWSYWQSPHEVYLDYVQPGGAHWTVRLGEGAIRDILHTNDIPRWAREACSVPERSTP